MPNAGQAVYVGAAVKARRPFIRAFVSVVGIARRMGVDEGAVYRTRRNTSWQDVESYGFSVRFDNLRSAFAAAYENSNRDVRLQLSPISNLTHIHMSKEELLALAREGKAQIEETESYVVTRYWIGTATSKELAGPAIRVDISEYGVEDAFYFAAGEAMVDLTPTEAEMIGEAVGVSLARD